MVYITYGRYNDVVGVWLVLWTKEATVMKEEAVLGREVFMYVCWEGYLEHGGNSVLTYHRGSSDCIFVRENMGVDDVVKIVEETIDGYTMKFDRNVIIPLQRDGDVVKLVKGNDEFSYMFVGEKEGLIQRSMQEKPVVGAAELKDACGVVKTDHAVRTMVEDLGLNVMMVEHANVGQQGWMVTKLGREKKLLMIGDYSRTIQPQIRRAKLMARSSVSIINEFPYRHATAVITHEKKWVYDYVSVCYKGPTQATCYMNIVYPMETNDMASMNNRTGHVGGGGSLDDDYNRRILPPLNPRKRVTDARNMKKEMFKMW
ncbi:hypothetical protein Cgig2_015866 [Carnegiea gigantea]|uniref:Uncharacterized protein n=1 Tax=Carnegiea gigantea TaxID=171969 RepID=A0A9Q1JMR3_9CARY|nr:hypothetical protein Cgig2_015866 [Carnegiea gigantea]